MNSTLDWLDFYDNQKCNIWHQNVTKIVSFVVFQKYSSACFIVFYIIRYSEYCTCGDFARMQMCSKRDTRAGLF